jgi:hypothetical protein
MTTILSALPRVERLMARGLNSHAPADQRQAVEHDRPCRNSSPCAYIIFGHWLTNEQCANLDATENQTSINAPTIKSASPNRHLPHER